MAARAQDPPDVVSPREWVRLLGGEDLAPVAPEPDAPVDVALYRFGDMPEPVALPALDAHYVSFTRPWRAAGRARPRARSRPRPVPARHVADPARRPCQHLALGRRHGRAAPLHRAVLAGGDGRPDGPHRARPRGAVRVLIGRWALLGPDSVDWWNQKVDERALRNELSKLDAEGKRRLVDELSSELAQPT